MQPVRRANLNLFEHDTDEKLIGEIPRHPIGYIFIAFNTIVVIIALLVVLFFGIRYQDDLTSSVAAEPTDITGILTNVILILVVLVVIVAFIGAYVYHGNYIIITDQKLVLVNMKNIIARRVSQLSIGDVQDVTIDQNTILSRIFKYGTINIETAGEQAHFMFPFAYNPHDCGKAIVDAHEQNLKIYGN